jgi:hypothetical protein
MKTHEDKLFAATLLVLVTGSAFAAAELARKVPVLSPASAEVRRQIDGSHMAARSDEPAQRPRTDPPDREEREKANRSRLAGIEASFQREPNDAAWSASMTAAVRSAMPRANEALRNEIRSVECRSRPCRVVIGADGSESLRHALPLDAGHLAEALPGVIPAPEDHAAAHIDSCA